MSPKFRAPILDAPDFVRNLKADDVNSSPIRCKDPNLIPNSSYTRHKDKDKTNGHMVLRHYLRMQQSRLLPGKEILGTDRRRNLEPPGPALPQNSG